MACTESDSPGGSTRGKVRMSVIPCLDCIWSWRLHIYVALVWLSHDVTGVSFSLWCSVRWWYFDRRKKRCIRFVADGETECSGDEADDATAMSSVPLAADSTTEIFSPMPLSASSSNPDDAPGVGSRPSAGGETESQSSVSSVGVGNVPPLCDDAMSSMTYAANVPKLSHTASTPSASGGGSLISSTIGEVKCKDSWDGCKVVDPPFDLVTAASWTSSSVVLCLLYRAVKWWYFRLTWSVAVTGVVATAWFKKHVPVDNKVVVNVYVRSIINVTWRYLPAQLPHLLWYYRFPHYLIKLRCPSSDASYLGHFKKSLVTTLSCVSSLKMSGYSTDDALIEFVPASVSQLTCVLDMS